MISYLVVAMRNKRRELILMYFIIYIYICVWCMFMCYDYSSPYLLVFGDDRVRNTREQMILQDELLRLSCGEGIAWEFYMILF